MTDLYGGKHPWFDTGDASLESVSVRAQATGWSMGETEYEDEQSEPESPGLPRRGTQSSPSAVSDDSSFEV